MTDFKTGRTPCCNTQSLSEIRTCFGTFAVNLNRTPRWSFFELRVPSINFINRPRLNASYSGVETGLTSRISFRKPAGYTRQRTTCPAVGHNEMSQTLHLGDVEVDEAKLADLCRRYEVRELSLFGSAARGEMRSDSDIDLLVEFLPNADVGLVEHAGLMLDPARLLGRKVDLVSKNGLKPRIRSSVLRDARLVYAA